MQIEIEEFMRSPWKKKNARTTELESIQTELVAIQNEIEKMP